jgi:AAA domain
LPGDQEPFPFYFVAAESRLESDHAVLIADIRSQTSGEIPVCVVLDTLNRSLGGDENSGKDMTGYINAAGMISSEFKCAVIIVHHCGHDESRMRGFSGLGGNVDCQIAVKRDRSGVIVATVIEAKDMPEGATIASRLQSVTVGFDADGEPITSCVIQPAEAPAPAKDKKRLTPMQDMAMRCLAHMKSSKGQPLPPEWDQHPAAFGVHATAWRKELECRGDMDGKDRRARKRFHELKNALKRKNAIAEREGVVWVPTAIA